MKILSAEQIRDWDEYTILNEPVSSYELMERAAGKCTTWLLKKFREKQIKIFCGKGNNGGDGLAIAQQLAENSILADVYIIELGKPGTADFQKNLNRLHDFPTRIHFIQDSTYLPILTKEDLIIDALLGSGLKRPPDGLYEAVILHINNAAATVISIDLPTGLFSDRMTKSEAIIKASYTLTFQTLKLAFLMPENEMYTGKVEVLDIGLHRDYLPSVHSIFEMLDETLIKQIYKPRKAFTHKGTYGRALVAAGERGKMGAAVLCTKACLHSGAGLVTACIPGDQFAILQISAPESMVISSSDVAMTDWTKYASIGIGPGMGTGMEGMQMLQTILANFNKPLVADADALNIIAGNQSLLNELPPASIITPHPKEFERLFGTSGNSMERLQTARYYAQKLFVYIILKGHYTLIACPDGEVYFNSTGNAGMATGGTGDVLTGMLAGLLAQGYTSKEACILGTYLHGLAGDIAAKQKSMEALTAGDVVQYIGKAFLKISRY